MTDLEEHVYFSTGCHHGLHEQCRRECKFCATPCQCECHAQKSFGPRVPEQPPEASQR